MTAELKTGDYIIRKGKPIKTEKDFKLIRHRLTSKDFSKIDLSKFEGCLLDVFNGWIDIEIKIWEVA